MESDIRQHTCSLYSSITQERRPRNPVTELTSWFPSDCTLTCQTLRYIVLVAVLNYYLPPEVGFPFFFPVTGISSSDVFRVAISKILSLFCCYKLSFLQCLIYFWCRGIMGIRDQTDNLITNICNMCTCVRVRGHLRVFTRSCLCVPGDM